MPIYCYICKSCDHSLKAMHCIKDILIKCPECDDSSLARVPSTFISINNTAQSDDKPGSLVKEKIEEFKKDLKNEKEKLSSEVL